MLRQKCQSNSSEFAYWRLALKGILFFLLVNTFPISAIASIRSLPETDVPAVPSLQIERRSIPRSFQVSSFRIIDTIVLHSVYNPHGNDRYSLSAILSIFRRARVAPHYLIDRGGRIYQLVEERNIAFHAGISRWQERTSLNRFSIGIELINHPSDSYTEEQYRALNLLLLDIRARHRIQTVVGHGEIAPSRRSDPWNFNWSRIASFR